MDVLGRQGVAADVVLDASLLVAMVGVVGGVGEVGYDAGLESATVNGHVGDIVPLIGLRVKTLHVWNRVAA